MFKSMSALHDARQSRCDALALSRSGKNALAFEVVLEPPSGVEDEAVCHEILRLVHSPKLTNYAAHSPYWRYCAFDAMTRRSTRHSH